LKKSIARKTKTEELKQMTFHFSIFVQKTNQVMNDKPVKKRRIIETKIRQYRLEKGLSQKTVSTMAEISHSAYVKIEYGKTEKIFIEVGKKISKALGVSFNELFDIVSENKGQEEELKAEIERLTKIVKGQKELLDLNDKLLKHYEKTYIAIYQESLIIVDDAIGTVLADFITTQNDPNATFQTTELKNKVMEQMRSKYIDFFTIAFQKMAAKTSNE
jgi:transcriptional regulator with XRE-family HTH domain